MSTWIIGEDLMKHHYPIKSLFIVASYKESKESSYIQYLDANNLYGWAMSQKLPVNGFKWINDVTEIYKKLRRR